MMLARNTRRAPGLSRRLQNAAPRMLAATPRNTAVPAYHQPAVPVSVIISDTGTSSSDVSSTVWPVASPRASTTGSMAKPPRA